ncbi:MAG: hypothetical protein GMKNLPBB_01015 [Myxococcota bacterium]|nr:hypothetical protein [Myxococcota bacterium]
MRLTWLREKCEHVNMLAIVDVSGIQQYVFDLPSEGGGQAARLRARSFLVQALADACARRFTGILGLPCKSIVLSVAGKAYIHAEDGFDAERLAGAVEQVEEEVRQEFGASPRVIIGATPLAGKPGVLLAKANSCARLRKLQPFAPPGGKNWDPKLLVGGDLRGKWSPECETDLGNKLRTVKSFGPAAGTGKINIVGIPYDLHEHEKVEREAIPLAQYVPLKGQDIRDFNDLATGARGAPYLAVVKVDVDNLGLSMKARLDADQSGAQLFELAKKLHQFFSVELCDLIAREKAFKETVYLVYGGGDDLCAVAPWDVAIEFAGGVHDEFTRVFQAEKLTLSCGIALMKPGFPLRKAVESADAELTRAKEAPARGKVGPKDQLAILSETWKWAVHREIWSSAMAWAKWVGPSSPEGKANRGWLQTINRLADARDKGDPLADARLHYYIVRNIEKNGKWTSGGAPDPREDFVKTPIGADYLGVTMRLALLATRGKEES